MVKVALTQNDVQQAGETRPPKRRRRPLLRLTFLALLALAAAPSALTYSGKAHSLLAHFRPQLAEAISFQTLQLHWWAPVEIRSLQVLDLDESEGRTITTADQTSALLQVRVVTSAQPLWRLALDRGRNARLTVVDPVVNLSSRDGRTNLQVTFDKLLGSSSAPTDETFPVQVKIENGTVHCLLESAAGQNGLSPVRVPAVLENIRGEVSTLNTVSQLPAISLTATVRSKGTTKLSGPLPQRLHRLTADLDTTISDFPTLPLKELTGETPENASESTLLRITLDPELDSHGRQLVQVGAKNLDLGILQPFLMLSGIPLQARGVLSGGIDARIAGPNPLDGVVGRILLEGKDVELRENSWAAGEWIPFGQVQASGAVALAEDGLLIDELSLTSDVVSLSGQGEFRISGEQSRAKSQHAELKATISLPHVLSSLRQTLSVHPDVRVEEGQLTLALSVQGNSVQADKGVSGQDKTAQNPTAAELNAVASADRSGTWKMTAMTSGLRIQRSGTVLTLDPAMRAEAFGVLKEMSPSLSHAVLTASFGTLECAPEGNSWNLAGQLDPEQFWQQIRQLTDIPQPGIKSQVAFQTKLSLDGDYLRLNDAVLTSSELQLNSPSLRIRPSAALPMMFEGQADLRGTASAVRTLIAPWHDAWWISDRSQVQCRLLAAPTKDIDFLVKIVPGKTAAIPRSPIRQASTSRSRPVIYTGSLIAESAFIVDEAELQLSIAARSTADEFDIRKGFVKLPGLHADLSGVMAIENDDLNVSVSAKTRYDLNVLSQRVFIPESGVQFEGTGESVFTLSGFPSIYGEEVFSPSTTAPRFQGTGVVAWTSAAFQGMQLGPAELSLEMKDYVIRSGPIRCTINGGEANVVPQYDIARSQLAFGTGSRVENLQLTQDFCGAWLGYLSPMLAASLDVRGTLSARVEQFLWDFEHVAKSMVSGQVTIHQAQASPGGSLTVLLELFDLIRKKSGSTSSVQEKALILPEQTVAVRVAQGFVVHEGLQMELSGYRLTSSGAVGFNQQLQLVLDVPLEKNASGPGSTIRVPLRGTVKQPQPDTAAMLQALGTQQLQNQLGDKLDKTINKQLDSLLKRF